VDLRTEFINRWLKKEVDVTVLAASFGISEKTAHKWLSRFRLGGRAALEDRSRRPHSSPLATSEAVKNALIELKKKHPTWGAKKLLVVLAARDPQLALPAASTAGEILKRAGLVQTSKRRRHLPKAPTHLQEPSTSNHVWCIDFKGQFNVAARPCYPLTLTDAFSRYLLLCQALPSTAGAAVRKHLELVFREYGLPEYVRSDNGSPFGGGLAGLSRLSVFLIRLGIRVEHIEPGKPQQNGRHERMHRTLKREAIVQPPSTWKDQQRAFDLFQREFNEQRPHEALGMKCPLEVYNKSPRSYPERLPQHEYATDCLVRKVRPDGCIRWEGEMVFLSESLAGEIVGLRESHLDGWWNLQLGPAFLGYIDSNGRVLKQARLTWLFSEGSPMSPV
jgi:transposase InsO family protein